MGLFHYHCMLWHVPSLKLLIKTYNIHTAISVCSALCDRNTTVHLCRSSWENHYVPECPIWLVLLACDSNLRHGGRKSNLEGVRPYYIIHLQCESHKCWSGCGWHKCLYGISGGGVYIWFHLQTGQSAV